LLRRITLLATLFVLSLVAAHSANAQLGIYGEFNATHDPTISAWYRGFTGGVYGNFLHAGPVRIGLDLRGAYATGDQYGYRNFLIGPRLEVKPPLLPIKPYVQASVGFGGSEYNGTSRLQTHYDNKLQYGVIGGVDYTLIPHVDLRVAEVEYLRMSGVSGATAPTVNLVTVGAGIVLRLP
jgi:opacity protein-like surface antigen